MHAVHFEAPAPGGSQPPTPGDPELRRPPPEPIVNAPWPVVTLTVAIVGLYFLQTQFPFVADLLAFSPHDLLQGRYEGLITSQFLHGGWPHALMNAAFVLAFGAPVARFFGPRPGGVTAFFLLYLVCGVLAALGFAAFHWGQYAPMVGASGAASGLMGAAARLLGGPNANGGRVGPLLSQPVTGMGLAWIVINLILAVTGGAFMPGAGEAGVAWEAHLAGFAAGVLLIGPVGWLAGRR
ncbi:rhomboid family intramembrane serine protease [Phenylobacterium sp. SCN 70-31]|uniref:rhomboid family intramembrane serine protease n=1 Tax=Phenylobacterium sp. SCN 70-31 TaxID=1660129 RepID=UPI000B1BB581|nr:rhomboid family intramembrane serine protease [Phenylobacterium sp. SCN 70-31]